MIEAIDLKFDLHCHTKEGSIDSKVSVAEFADRFMELGYDGFMISDHNSYKGCKAWDAIKNDPKYRNFTVIRGIEYDTKDAGHILVILPDGIYPRVLRIRGLKCSTLIKLVHSLGGILGPTHPFGVATSSAMGFKKMKMSYIKHFDFIETFNTCEFVNSNRLAKDLADRFDMPSFAGSDAHVPEYIGMACTEINAQIHCNNDLIAAVKFGADIKAFGTEREITKKAKRKEHWIGRVGYQIYNRGIGKMVYPYRSYHHRKLGTVFHIHM